jgi:hypothetical protein
MRRRQAAQAYQATQAYQAGRFGRRVVSAGEYSMGSQDDGYIYAPSQLMQPYKR